MTGSSNSTNVISKLTKAFIMNPIYDPKTDLLWLENRRKEAIALNGGIEAPLAAYAPGHYLCHCRTCSDDFMGDKRSLQCERCAVQAILNEKYIIKVLDFVAENYVSGGAYDGPELLAHYKRKIFDDFLASDEYKNLKT